MLAAQANGMIDSSSLGIQLLDQVADDHEGSLLSDSLIQSLVADLLSNNAMLGFQRLDQS